MVIYHLIVVIDLVQLECYFRHLELGFNSATKETIDDFLTVL